MILLVQFRDDVSKDHEQKCVLRHVENKNDVVMLDALDNSIDWENVESLISNVDKILLGGSGNISIAGGHGADMNQEQTDRAVKNITPLIRYILKNDIPTLGVCLGHQILGHFLGSKIKFDTEQAESGIFNIILTEEAKNDPIFKDVPNEFEAVVGHQDSVIEGPKHCVLLAKSEKCPVHAFKYKNNIYGTQFHSELNTEDLIYRLNLYPSYKKYADKVEIKDTSNALKVLNNFLNL